MIASVVGNAVRLSFCQLIRSCILGRKNEIRTLGEKFAGPLYKYFPLILSPWFIFGSNIGSKELRAAHDGRLPPDVRLKVLKELWLHDKWFFQHIEHVHVHPFFLQVYWAAIHTN